MRTRNALERLAAVAPAVEAPIDAGEEDRILARILASDRVPQRRRPKAPMLLVGIAVLAAAVAVATVELVHQTNPPAPRASGGRHLALTGPRIKLAGYHFRTPAGYTASTNTCQFSMPPAQQPGTPVPVLHSFSDAASADGGCLEALLIGGGSPVPADATAVAVGSYDGFVASRGSQESLFVAIPAATGDHYLVLLAQGLTADQLIAIAETGLPSGAALPTTTCSADCG